MKLLVRRKGENFIVKLAVNVPGMDVDFPEREVVPGRDAYGLSYRECEALAGEQAAPENTSPEGAPE